MLQLLPSSSRRRRDARRIIEPANYWYDLSPFLITRRLSTLLHNVVSYLVMYITSYSIRIVLLSRYVNIYGTMAPLSDGRRLVGKDGSKMAGFGASHQPKKSSVNLYIRLFCTIVAATAGKIQNQTVISVRPSGGPFFGPPNSSHTKNTHKKGLSESDNVGGGRVYPNVRGGRVYPR